MATTVTIKLALPYPMRPDEIDALKAQKKAPEEWARDFSEQMILAAVRAVHGQELDRKDAKIVARIKRELDKLEGEVTLDGTQAEFLFGCFFGEKAEGALKIRPEHSVWFFTFLDALEETRQAFKAQDG